MAFPWRSPQLLEGMRKAGCFSLFWGVESASPPTIRLLGKKFGLDLMFETIDAAVGLGIRNHIHMIYNTPHEIEEDVRLFIRLVERYGDSEQVVFVPHRFRLEAGSSMVEHPQKYGLSCLKRRRSGLFEREIPL
jgi:anaerobic magnesium-protoporphyrin IX monomethyl ester cyclase